MSVLASLLPSGLTPTFTLAVMDRHLGWALALTAVTLFMLKPAPQFVRFALGVMVFLLTLVPATWGLSHWLGLAYQTPSLVTQGLAVLYLFHAFTSRGTAVRGQVTDTRWPLSVLLVGVAVGWILVLDTFAVFPAQLYALGYSMEGAMFGLVVAVAFWVISMRSSSMHEGRRARHLAIILLFSVFIFTFTRLPSGNVWDAMLDPWLWLTVQGVVFARIVRCVVDSFRYRKALPDKDASAGTIRHNHPIVH